MPGPSHLRITASRPASQQIWIWDLMIQQLNSVDQYCCLFHIVHQGTTVLLSKEATACAGGSRPASRQLLRDGAGTSSSSEEIPARYLGGHLVEPPHLVLAPGGRRPRAAAP
jgi:hypothetical protein